MVVSRRRKPIFLDWWTEPGESLVIAKAGKPLVKVVPLNASETGQVKRIRFLERHISVPEDFDRLGRADIEQFFG